jgi:hypothetical protein
MEKTRLNFDWALVWFCMAASCLLCVTGVPSSEIRHNDKKRAFARPVKDKEKSLIISGSLAVISIPFGLVLDPVALRPSLSTSLPLSD